MSEINIEITGSLGTRNISPKISSLSIKKELDKGYSCGFATDTEEINEWDVLDITEDTTTIFAGVVEKVEVSSIGLKKEWRVTSTGWRRLFDRLKVVKRYNNSTAGDIVKDIIDNFTEGFTYGTISDGVTIESIPFNYEAPTDCIKILADAIGFSFIINNDKSVDFFDKSVTVAPQVISDTSANFSNLKIKPDVSNFANVVYVRGGKDLSSEVSYKEVGDGQKTVFVLGEKPKEVTVKVNGVPKTTQPKFGDTTPTAEFMVNYNEKYIENGTHAVLTSSDTLEVLYKYEYAIRIRRTNTEAIAILKALFPSTNGEVELVINDQNIETLEDARTMATTQLETRSKARISGSFQTYETVFEPGQVLTIEAKGFSKQVLVQKITIKHNSGVTSYDVEFSTVLFDFERFLLYLLRKQKPDLDSDEVVEFIVNQQDTLVMKDEYRIVVDDNRSNEVLNLADEYFISYNKTVECVLAPYFPSDFVTDNKRNFTLDVCILA